MMLEVWIVPLCKLNINLVSYCTILTDSEAKRYLNFYRESDARLYLNSHILLKAILCQKTSLSVVQINHGLYTNDYGKPFLQGGPFFSISHTSDMFLMAVSDRPIGIDVENCHAILLNKYDFDMILSPAEKKYIASVNDLATKKALFFQTWSKKESVVKALGIGLYQPFDKIVTSIRNSIVNQSERVLVQQELKSLWFHTLALDLEIGFVGYVSGRNRLLLDQVHWINAQQKLQFLLGHLK